ncbi:hypothetical protein [Gilvimarinus chinensis]|uniref:hypothetical protein n=1 Tax=Gilvimarinus chinensis TaxID=396005 RepID=UPI00035CCB74|nr:hypothetical protein [Gilvimarinus chinensis]
MAMVPKTLNDLLNVTQKFHTEMAKELNHSEAQQHDERHQLLLQHLADKEQVLADTLAELKLDSDLGPLQTWFYEYTDRHPIAAFEPSEINLQEYDIDSVATLVTDWHRELVDLFMYLTERAESNSTQKLARDVLAIESSHAKQMSYDMTRMNEI